MLAITEEANEYRKNFHDYYYKNIKPILNGFEAQRKVKYTQQKVLVVVSLVLIISAMLFLIVCGINNVDANTGYGRLMGLTCFFISILGAGGIFLSYNLGKKFEKQVKDKIMPVFLKFFGGFDWAMTDDSLREDIRNSNLVGHFNTIKSDDYFQGLYKDLKIKISNCIIRKNGKTPIQLFWGVFVKVTFNKKINSRVIVTGSALSKGITSEVRGSLNMQRVELEDPEFDRMFNVYSQDQVEARYLLTTAFMERFKNLKKVYKSESISASFVDDSLYMALNCDKDMFHIADLRKPITDTGEIQQLFEEFLAVISLVDLLKLDSKTGL
ncbi:MAG: DUF3137 domain-containing protein [Candidatus Gastranaerophilaceae bacterium]